MTEELANQGGVAPAKATGTESAVAPAKATATSGQPIAGSPEQQPGAPAPAQPKTDLTTLPEFRAYQAAVDREKEAARRQAQAYQQQLAQLQAQQAQLLQQFEAARLKGADPEEAVQYLQTQLEQERQQTQAAVQQQTKAAELQERATKMLSSLGLDFDAPGLDLGGGATEAGYTVLLESALKIAAERGSKAKTEAEEAALKAAQAAQVETARQMGATTVSTSTGPGGTPTDPFGGEKDPNKRLAIALGVAKKK